MRMIVVATRTVIMIVVMGFDNRAHIRVSWSKV